MTIHDTFCLVADVDLLLYEKSNLLVNHMPNQTLIAQMQNA